jgi:hypothetical protein
VEGWLSGCYRSLLFDGIRVVWFGTGVAFELSHNDMPKFCSQGRLIDLDGATCDLLVFPGEVSPREKVQRVFLAQRC